MGVLIFLGLFVTGSIAIMGCLALWIVVKDELDAKSKLIEMQIELDPCFEYRAWQRTQFPKPRKPFFAS